MEKDLMNYARPQYKVKYHGKGEWKEITESEFFERILEVFDSVTPAILDIIGGKQIQTGDATFKIENFVQGEY